MVRDPRLPLISFTGSVPVGRHVAAIVGQRLGRTLLELSGNNAVIVDHSADIDLAVRAIVFGAVGTAGQRCTTTRRLLVHESCADELLDRLVNAYKQVRIGNPLDSDVLLGPLIDHVAVEAYRAAIDEIKKEGGEILYGGRVLTRPGYFVEPTIVRRNPTGRSCNGKPSPRFSMSMTFRTLDEAIAIQNGVPQGLSSAMFTNNLRHGERFLSASGSDCGIANINIGTSGAEDRRRVRWREGNGRRPRSRVGRLESLYAAADQHGKLGHRSAARTGHQVRLIGLWAKGRRHGDKP